MKQQTMPRRLLCAVCAVVLLVSAVPAAWAAEPDADTAAPVQSLTASEATEMQQADAAVTALTDSADYAAMSAADRKAAALEQLDDLVQQGWWQRLHLCRRGKRHGELLLQLRRAGRHPAGGPG